MNYNLNNEFRHTRVNTTGKIRIEKKTRKEVNRVSVFFNNSTIFTIKQNV
jgi:hypothetical protein